MRAHLCECGCGELIVEDSVHHYKAFINQAHKQKAYRARKKLAALEGKKTGIPRHCLNCGEYFLAKHDRHVFHRDSCRVSYFQQMKRLKEREGSDEQS